MFRTTTLPATINMPERPSPRWYLAHVGTVNDRPVVLAYSDAGAYLGIWYGRAVVPCPVPEGWQRAGGADWQAVTVGQDGRLRFSFPFPGRDGEHAARNWKAQQ